MIRDMAARLTQQKNLYTGLSLVKKLLRSQKLLINLARHLQSIFRGLNSSFFLFLSWSLGHQARCLTWNACRA